MIIPLFEEWTSQPTQAAGIDWSDPLARGLVDVIDLSGSIPRSVILGTPPTSFGTKPVGGVFRHGRAADASVAFGGWFFQRSDGKYTAAEQTHVAVAQYDSATGNYGGYFATADGSGASNSASLQDATGGDVWLYPAGVKVVGAANSFRTSTPLVLVATFNSAAHAIYVNGDRVASVTGASVPDYSTSRLVLFGERSGSSSYAVKGRAALHLLYNRILTASEIRMISANPWQVFEP